MAWEQLSINKPHLVYIILGGFTSIFMLVSLFVKEKLYIGEASVATLCGVIFGPHAANLINPLSWGNTDQITIEFSRIVLVVQCFAVGVELPKAYMERHWKSVIFLLVPVMTFGWLVTSLFIWWMIVPLTWLESLVVAACVTATDPVLASSVVGKGKFAKRVPKHLRDLLSAESGCNDGMAFPFVYLSLYLLQYNLRGPEVVKHWICVTVLYECIFGAFYGVVVGYIGRHAIRWAERKGIVDRESFLVFYFVLALFCAGSGSMLGMDDLLVGFAAGVGFSNDGWFTEKTEESHVSNVIDLLINLSYFVYFGTIIPWDQYNAHEHGLAPWRLVVIAIFVIFFRRIPIMLICKPFIPDIKTWREALFAGHFGPIGVGAIFVAILARAEAESETPEPLAKLPPPGSKDYEMIYLVWPIVTFLVISSILVHGSSIAVFTLGKRINTLTITLSYTQDNEKGAAWMNRLPRISSQSKSMSRMSSFSTDEKEGAELPPGMLPSPGGLNMPKLLLRRQRDEDYEKDGSRSSSLRPIRRRKRKPWDQETGMGPGGVIAPSAITPARRAEPALIQQESGSDTLAEKSEETSPEAKQETPEIRSPASSPDRGRRSRSISPRRRRDDVPIEAYNEGEDVVVEDEEGNVLSTFDASHNRPEDTAGEIEKVRKNLAEDESGEYAKHKLEPHAKNEGEQWIKGAEEAVQQPQKTFRQKLGQWKGFGQPKDSGAEGGEPSRRKKPEKPEKPERKRGPAHAYQFGNTIIVEDEDGEVIKKYTLPAPEGGDRRRAYGQDQLRHGMQRMGTWVGIKKDQDGEMLPTSTVPGTIKEESGEGNDSVPDQLTKRPEMRRRPSSGDASDDDGLRMTISRTDQYGLTGLQKKVGQYPERSISLSSGRRLSTRDFLKQMQQLDPKGRIEEVEESDAPADIKREIKRDAKAEKEAAGQATPGPQRRTVGEKDRPDMANRSDTAQSKTAEASDYFSMTRPQAHRMHTNDTLDSDSPGPDIPTHDVRSAIQRHGAKQGLHTAADARRARLATIRSNEEEAEEEEDEEGETAAEKRRRLAALGLGGGSREDDSDESDEERVVTRQREAVQEPGAMEVGAAGPANRALRVQWGGERGRDRAAKVQEESEPSSRPGSSSGAVGRKVRGMFKR